jgi:hypothetical protein
MYRVQSSLRRERSTLRGVLAGDDASITGAVTRALDAHPLRSGGRGIQLRSAHVMERSGLFASCADVLYKRELFEPDPGTPALATHIIDLDKARARWSLIEPTLDLIWGPQAAALRALIADPDQAVRDEYFVHEAGHLVGFDIDAKMRSKHFVAAGQLLWPLVYLEEVRADLHALALAADAYDATRACAVFGLHVSTRLGVNRLDRAQPYGLVPFLLIAVLSELGAIEINGEQAVLVSTRADALLSWMRECGRWASERITMPELHAMTTVERALVGATRIRAYMDDPALVARYDQLMRAPR